ncbi:MAG TPA: ADP-ribosylglycohydrolase family protein [Micromonospora sp.]
MTSQPEEVSVDDPTKRFPGVSRPGRVRGCLLWAACADALGAPFESRLVVDPAAVDDLLANPPRHLRWTDDTALTLVLAEHLTGRGGAVDADELAPAFAAEWARDPGLGYGGGVSRQFERILAGESWRDTSVDMFGGQGSYGNGAAMRVAPVGLLPGVPLPEVAELARRSAVVTHAHPEATDGAAVQAVAVALAAGTDPADRIDPDRFVAALLPVAQSAQFRAALAELPDLVRHRAAPERVAGHLGSGVRAVESVPAALAAFLHAPGDPAAVLRFAVRMGGDTDTVAAMATAVAGAYCGDQALPERWWSRLAELPRLARAAEALSALPTR